MTQEIRTLNVPGQGDFVVPVVLNRFIRISEFAAQPNGIIDLGQGGIRSAAIFNNSDHGIAAIFSAAANAQLIKFVPANGYRSFLFGFPIQDTQIQDLVQTTVPVIESATQQFNLDAQRNQDQYPFENQTTNVRGFVPPYVSGGFIEVSLSSIPVQEIFVPNLFRPKLNYSKPYAEASGANTTSFPASDAVTGTGITAVETANYWSGFIAINPTATAFTVDISAVGAGAFLFTVTIPANSSLNLPIEANSYTLHTTAVGQVFIPYQMVNYSTVN